MEGKKIFPLPIFLPPIFLPSLHRYSLWFQISKNARAMPRQGP